MEDDESTRLLTPEMKRKEKISFLRGGIPCGIAVILYFLPYYLYISWLSQYVHQRIRDSYFNSSNTSYHGVGVCDRNMTRNGTIVETEIQQKASKMILYLSLGTSVPSLLVNLVMGSYSDSIGRRTLFMIAIFGNLAKGVVTLVVVKLNLHLSVLFLAFVLDGVGGSFTTVLLASLAYTADITPLKNTRTLAIASMEVALAVGLISGNLATGFLISSTGFFYPIVLNTGLLVMSLLCVFFLLPESIDTKLSASVSKSPVAHLKSVFGFYFCFGNYRLRRQYIVVVLIFCLGLAGRFGRDNTETLYVLNHPFCWDSQIIGYFGALRMGIAAIGTMLFIKIMLICVRDEYIMLMGMLSQIGGLVLEGMASSDLMMWLVPLTSSIEPTSSPVARAMLSRMTSPSQQGALFASIATVETVTAFVGTTMYGSVYSATVGSMKGAVFLIMSLWPVIAICACLMYVAMLKEGSMIMDTVIGEDSKKQSSMSSNNPAVEGHVSPIHEFL